MVSLLPTGPAPDGEVEDYQVLILPEGEEPPPPEVVTTVTPDPASLDEPGGMVVFSVEIANTSPLPVVVTSMLDGVFGPLPANPGNCVVPRIIPPLDSISCKFEGSVNGSAAESPWPSSLNVGFEWGSGFPGESIGEYGVVINDVLPTFTLELTSTYPPNPPGLETRAPGPLEPVGPTQWNIKVTNTGVEVVKVVRLSDSLLGDLNEVGNCTTGINIIPPTLPGKAASRPAPSTSYSCSFITNEDANAGEPVGRKITAAVEDDEMNEAEKTESVGFVAGDRLPSITVTKTADPTVVVTPGGLVTFSLSITNDNADLENVILTEINDDMFGPVPGMGDCPGPLPWVIGKRDGADSISYECSFQKPVNGPPGTHVNNIAVTYEDDEGNADQSFGDAVVTIAPTDGIFKDSFEGDACVLGDIEVEVGLSDENLRAFPPGGLVSFDVTVTNIGATGFDIVALEININGETQDLTPLLPVPTLAPGEAGSVKVFREFPIGPEPVEISASASVEADDYCGPPLRDEDQLEIILEPTD